MRINAMMMYCLSVAPCWPSPNSFAPRSSPVWWVECVSVVMGSGRDQVDEREDDDPHDVDEVPVEADDLDDLALVARHAAAAHHPRQGQQHDDADGDVGAVEPGQRVEARREQ